MTSHLNSHRTTDIKPEMLSGVPTGIGTPHDKYNIRGIAHARTNRKDNIFMQRRLVLNFTFILEWGQGTCSLTKHTRRWTYSECCLVHLAAFFDLVKLLFELGLASIPCAVGGIILLANYLLLQQRGWLYIHFNHLYQRWSSSYSANLQQRWHCPKQDGLSAGNSNSLKFVILEQFQESTRLITMRSKPDYVEFVLL